jgi:sec-independent protein translocase protein TatC
MSDEPEESLAEGTLISHLLELRTRLVRAGIAVLIAFIPCAYYSNRIFTFVAKPLTQKLQAKGVTLIATGVMSPFTVPFKLSFFVALFIAMPFVLYQAWAFVAPGLYRHEKLFAVPLVISSILLFYLGTGFAYVFVFPLIFGFFTTTAPEGVTMMTDITAYLDFVLRMFLGFGLAFETPIAVVLLAITGLVSLDKLRKARGYVLIGIFVVAAILTPPDALSQCFMAVPMYLLYEGGILMARILLKLRRNQAEREAAKAQ